MDTNMSLVERDVKTSYQHHGARAYKAKSTEGVSVVTETSSQDESLWECAIANSMDAICELADKALADRQAGRTKKIAL